MPQKQEKTWKTVQGNFLQVQCQEEEAGFPNTKRKGLLDHQDHTAYCQRCQKIKKKILETESAEPVYTAKNHKQGVPTEKEQKQIPETIQIFAVKKGSLLLKGVQKFSCIALYLHIAYSAGNDRDHGRQKNDVHNRQMVKNTGYPTMISSGFMELICQSIQSSQKPRKDSGTTNALVWRSFLLSA